MPLLKMRVAMTGRRHIRPGQVVEFSERIAERIVANRLGVPVEGETWRPKGVTEKPKKQVPPPDPEGDPGPEPDTEDVQLSTLEIAQRTLGLLAAAGVTTASQFLALEDPTKITGIGRVTANQVRQAIDSVETPPEG